MPGASAAQWTSVPLVTKSALGLPNVALTRAVSPGRKVGTLVIYDAWGPQIFETWNT